VPESLRIYEKLVGKRTGIASILVPARSFKELRSVLERFGAEYEKEDVWISRI
jgi:hypothetical protein